MGNYNAEDAIRILSDEYGTDIVKQSVSISDNINSYLAEMLSVKFGDCYFISRKFMNGVPMGYRQEELFYCTDLPFTENDSFNESFVNFAYDSLEPKVQQKYPPVYFENFFGKVFMCISFEPDSIIDSYRHTIYERLVQIMSYLNNVEKNLLDV